jgi:peptidyl-prolyl cis-trans isomerase A (cyclophilin A)
MKNFVAHGMAIGTLIMAASVARACDVPGLPQLRKSPSVSVSFNTTRGRFDVEVDLQRAPVTACNCLRYVAEGAYVQGAFRRTVRPDNQKGAEIPIEVVQAFPRLEHAGDELPAIPLERTKDTGLRHGDGTLSMARSDIDDANSEFFICIGDQPELDYGGHRNPDGQGFAAFGKVTMGMSVVRAIQLGSAQGERLTPPITILSARIKT